MIDDEEAPYEAINNLTLGEVMPQVTQDQEKNEDGVRPSSSTRVEPPSLSGDQGQDNNDDDQHRQDHTQDQA
jgi:hypothetical protein